MKASTLLCAILLAASAAHAAPPAHSPRSAGGFDIAITVDDLTVHGSLPAGTTWPAIAHSYINTLKSYRVPQAYGFINAKRLVDAPDSAPVLDAWIGAGYPLGNHTYSHLGLSQAPSLEAWIEDAKRNEPVLSEKMGKQDWRWLRYPFLDAGSVQARHDGALAWLKSNNYRVADVTVSFDDWAYTGAYTRCLAKGDEASIAAMKSEYLRRVDEHIARMKAMSQAVYGRMVPQVLLTHLGAWSAATLPQVMEKLDAAGARYVPLGQAQSDAIYRDTSPGAGNGLLMERKAQEMNVDTSGVPSVSPMGNLAAMCR